MSEILYVYGTLRPGGEETVLVPGTLYDCGWFPGIKLEGDSSVVCETIPVVDWTNLDRYEGYNPNDLEGSLYIRTPFRDGSIYVFNQRVSPSKLIESGDWLEYTKKKGEKIGRDF